MLCDKCQYILQNILSIWKSLECSDLLDPINSEVGDVEWWQSILLYDQQSIAWQNILHCADINNMEIRTDSRTLLYNRILDKIAEIAESNVWIAIRWSFYSHVL